MSKKNIVEDTIKMLVQQGNQWLPFYKRYVLWKRTLRKRQSGKVYDHIARILAYYGLTPTSNGIEGELHDIGYQKRDVLTVLYALAPKEKTHTVVADSLELAILRWAGVPLSKEEGRTYYPNADLDLVNEVLDSDLDGFMQRRGFSYTRLQIRERFDTAIGEYKDRLISEDSVRKMMERRKREDVSRDEVAKFMGELSQWQATLTDKEKDEIMIEIVAMIASKKRQDT